MGGAAVAAHTDSFWPMTLLAILSLWVAFAGVDVRKRARTAANTPTPRRRVFTRNPRKPFTLARLPA